MKILKNFDLTEFNTFRVPARARYFVEARSEEDLREIFKTEEFRENPRLYLGGGSNVLFTKDWDGIVISDGLMGIGILAEDSQKTLIRARAGEVWQDLVLFAVGRGLWGIENLSSIPGSVGAAPVQNIGAYGAELKNVLESVEALDVGTGELKIFSQEEFAGGYRDSVFKKNRGKYFITAVTLRLLKSDKPNLSYKGLREYVERNRIDIESPQAISRAVTEIRKEKLPDPSVIPNAGSFFKNIIVDEAKLAELLHAFPEMPHFPDSQGAKISSAWLIEHSGWKGRRLGSAGVYAKHALVLVNHGRATGREIKELADRIMESVRQKFGLELIPEVNLI